MKGLFGKNAVLFAVVVLGAGVAVAALSLKGEPPRKLRYGVSQKARTVAPGELAQWIVEGKKDFVVIDLRDGAAFGAGHVKDAVHCGSCHASKAEGKKAMEETTFVDLSKKLVLYTDTGEEEVELPKLLAKNPRLYTLKGGFQGWKQDILAPVVFGGEADADALHLKLKKEAVRAYFAGERADTTRPAELPTEPIKKKAAHQPATAHEGC